MKTNGFGLLLSPGPVTMTGMDGIYSKRRHSENHMTWRFLPAILAMALAPTHLIANELQHAFTIEGIRNSGGNRTSVRENVTVIADWTIHPLANENESAFGCMANTAIKNGRAAFALGKVDHLILILETNDLRLRQGDKYPVRIQADTTSTKGQAEADAPNAAVIRLSSDEVLVKRLRSARKLEVTIARMMISIPFDQGPAVLDDLYACWGEN
jgi:hypothetical protein